jgi:RNA polymerase sigma-70 factor (ECF subfamily)
MGSKGQRGRDKEKDRMELALVQSTQRPEDLAGLADEDLIVLVDAGNDRAFEILVDRYKTPIMNFVYRMLGDADASEDLTQETLIRVYRNAGRYKRIAKFSTWIYTIAANLAKNELRNRSRRAGVTWEDVQNYNLKTDDTAPMRVRPVTSDGAVETHELRVELDRAIRSLPDSFRTPFVLRDVEGFAYEEIAKMLKLPKGTVKSRINRARLRFKEYIEENFPDVAQYDS